ncbi:sacsin N-terminal ATP-binding-like domain-containing protein [Pseudomonas yamanorum]|uniref:sacsin N-terminal ATP-binding-like domain-containing protein n=1 Tax=Pseudomonas yamanorum TaxID=515393 RepID=UPI00087970FD|nr:DUF3883 domain-containing protein [Pseudomonas yamanorum]SDU32578.1 protein of unknown function [Pseudomonas yamanorum]
MTPLNAAIQSNYQLDFERGREAARLIWEDDPTTNALVDPRSPAFAHAMIDASVEELRNSKGLLKKMIDRATAGAEDLAVAQFQGVIEVIQNADDVRANEVRFALRDGPRGRQLLIVHDGEPVTCHNVLGMALPYLTSKTERTDQRGRFGIGMKTLKRVADAIAVHSAPYHFSSDQQRFGRIDAEPEITGFYEPSSETLLVADLSETFEEESLSDWFDTWRDEGLMFLASVSRFRWCEINGTTRSERSLVFSPWVNSDYSLHHQGMMRLQSRHVVGPENNWTIWRATVQVPTHLHPAHKARSDETNISIALGAQEGMSGLFIGFRTQVTVSLPFSLDAQFDPSTSREAIIENAWNSWLIDRTCDVVATISAGLLASEPKRAWAMVPLAEEGVGETNDYWLHKRFSLGLQAARNWLGREALICLRSGISPLANVVYEDEVLDGLLDEEDLGRMVVGLNPLEADIRDIKERWRQVLRALGVSRVLGTEALLESLENGSFESKPASWWVESGSRLVLHHPDDGLFDRAFLLSHRHLALSCKEFGETARPLVFGATPSPFSERWGLLERLHWAYAQGDVGETVINWLETNAAFVTALDARTELAAFAEAFKDQKIDITDDDLRNLRARFDEIPDQQAEPLGLEIGAVLRVDGHVFKSGKASRQKVSLAESYLCKTLDGENSTWPDAAGATTNIQWISARYEAVLKTEAGKWAKRKREDGSVSRGPRKFLSLLGGESAPRVMRLDERVRWGGVRRSADLRQKGAELVRYDQLSPDLSRVLHSLLALSKRDARVRSSALLRTLSRNWDRVYSTRSAVPAEHMAIKYTYSRGEISAAWLNELRDSRWIAVGRGELVVPQSAVLRTPETQTTYSTFVCDIVGREINSSLVASLNLITDVRIGDLLATLEKLRDSGEVVTHAQTLPLYRTIAKRCPPVTSYNARIGELSVQELRQRFLANGGLIHVGESKWRGPNELMMGMDIFHDRQSFVPGGIACTNLWVMLGVEEPDFDDCIQFCRDLAGSPYDPDAEAVLMDVYRYMEGIKDLIEPRHRAKLRTLPVRCEDGWTTARPVFYVENSELRNQFAKNILSLKFWIAPCDVRDLTHLMKFLAIVTLSPSLKIEAENEEAVEYGEQTRLRFLHALDHLSTELARSAPALRDRIAIGWDELKALPLMVYQQLIPVMATSPDLPMPGVLVLLRAFMQESPPAFHFRDDDIGDRDSAGKVIASMFPVEGRRRIDAEWVLAWQKSRDIVTAEIRLASDEKRNDAMQEAAAAINASLKEKIIVTQPKSSGAYVKPRTLKESVGAVVGATINLGVTRVKPAAKPVGILKTKPPSPSDTIESSSPSAPAAYTNADLEQRGWEILVQALETSADRRLVDFRKRQGVGADGVFEWKTFVEMKATARSPQSQIELSNNEFKRAKERGSDFILALVSGLETGYRDEVRLIFDPANCATIRPTNGVRLVALLELPSIIIHFENT